MSTSQDMTEQEMWQELVRFTGNEYAAAGIMGNLKAESNLNSSNLQQTYERSLGYSDSSYTAAVDNGSYNNFVNDSAGYGLAQWTYSSRKQGLLNYARQTGQSIGSTRMQLQYLENELSQNYGSTLSALKNARSVKEASDIMITQYERPANQSNSAKNSRASSSTNFYNQYRGIGAASSGINLSQDPTLQSLSDVTLEVEPDAINTICNQWESKILAANISSIDVTSSFSALTNVGVATAYVPSLKNALQQIEALILSASNTIKGAAEDQASVDQEYQNRDQGYSGGHSSGGKKYKNKTTSDEVPTIDPATGPLQTETDETTVDNTNQKVEINTDFVDKIEKLESDSYIKFMTMLGSIANGDLLAYLADEQNASNLKKKILESPGLDEDLKKIISEMDDKVLQVTLQKILTKEDVISASSRDIIFDYTEKLSNGTNIDILKVSKEVQFYNKVDELFNSVNTLINKEDIMKNVLSIYDGNGVSELGPDTITFIRCAVDKMAKDKGVSYEELLTNKSNEQYVKDTLSDLSKSLSYFRTVNTMGTEASQLLFSNAMKARA